MKDREVGELKKLSDFFCLDLVERKTLPTFVV